MVIKEAEWQKCSECGRSRKTRKPVYGCDHCGKEIDPNSQDQLLCCTSFNLNGEETEFEFCSWPCFFANLAKIEIKDFLDFPYLTPDTVQEFWAAIRSIKTKSR